MTILTINLKGGIGNQLFQIAFIYGLSKRLGLEYCIQDGQFGEAITGTHPSKYYTSVYKKVCRKQIHIEKTIEEKMFTFYDIVSDTVAYLNQPTLQFNGYFQSDKYFYGFDQEIKHLFTPAGGIREWLTTNSDLSDRYPELFKDTQDACFIGVRRGDYIRLSHVHNPCGMDYYTNAMTHFPSNQKYYIGSDDIEWCKTQFIGDQFVFFDIADDLLQFYAGCLFKKYIIANSTFHWWMSFLSVFDTPIIYAPNKWVFGPTVEWHQYSTIYRKDMIVLERV